MNSISLCGVALLCYAALMILGKEKNGIGALIGLGGTLCLLLPALLSFSDLSKSLEELFDSYGFFGSELLFRSFGIGFCCEFTSGICKDAGFGELANALDFSCKVAILTLCIPLWKEIFSLIGGLVP